MIVNFIKKLKTSLLVKKSVPSLVAPANGPNWIPILLVFYAGSYLHRNLILSKKLPHEVL